MGVETPQPMMPSEAIKILQKMYEKLSDEEELLDVESPLTWDGILLSDLGTKEQRITSGSLNELSTQDVGVIHCMVIPANFSEMEKEAFNRRRMVE